MICSGTLLHRHCNFQQRKRGPEPVVAVAVIAIVVALLGTVFLAAISGFFAAVAVVPIGIKVSGDPEPVVVVAVTVIADIVVILAVLLGPFLLTATGEAEFFCPKANLPS